MALYVGNHVKKYQIYLPVISRKYACIYMYRGTVGPVT